MARTRQSASAAYQYPSNYGKNAIMNGSFEIWQRGTSFAAAADGTFSADRWKYSKVGAAVHTLSRSTDIPTVAEAGILAPYSLLADCTTVDASIASGDYVILFQGIEGYVWRNFAQRDLTLSFWVRATKTGTYCATLKNPTDRAFVAEYTVSTTDTWEKKTVQFPASPSAGTWDYTTGAGAYLIFTLACGSTFQTTAGAWQSGAYFGSPNQVNAGDSTSNDFRLALVQLEVGDQASDFAVVPFPDELARCQRYFEKSYRQQHAPGTTLSAADAGITGVATHVVCTDGNSPLMPKVTYAVPKRTLPTVVAYALDGTAAKARNENYDGTNDRNVTTTYISGEDGFIVVLGDGLAASSVFGNAAARVYYAWTSSADF